MSKWRDRFSDAAVAAYDDRLLHRDAELYEWEEDSHGWNNEEFTYLFSSNNLVRARVYDSLSCDGLAVDEI